MRKFVLLSLCLLGAGCANGQIDATKVQTDATTLNTVCTTAMTLSPFAGPIAPWIIGGCGTAEGLAKLASDPTSIAWVNGLIADVRKLKPSA